MSYLAALLDVASLLRSMLCVLRLHFVGRCALLCVALWMLWMPLVFIWDRVVGKSPGYKKNRSELIQYTPTPINQNI